MSRLCRVNRMCSSNVSDTANMSGHGSTLCSPTVEKLLCRSPFRSGHMSAICARLSKGKGRFTRGWKPQVSTLLCARAASAHSLAEVQRKTLRPSGANTPAAVRVPRSAGAEKKPPVRGEHAYAVRVPGQPVPKKPPARFAFPRLPYAEKTKKAPLTRCLSLLWICRPLSSSSCRNYRSRRRYYHHRYRRNRSRRCPDRSIPRSG